MSKKMIVLFLMGFIVSALVLPFLRAVGVPSFDVVLTNIFGENHILAFSFSVLLLLGIISGVHKAIKSE